MVFELMVVMEQILVREPHLVGEQHLRAQDRRAEHDTHRGVARGVGVGALTGCGNPDRDDPSAEDVVREGLGSLGLPMVSDLSFGHTAENHSWPYGGRARLDGDSGEITLLEASTASLEGTR